MQNNSANIKLLVSAQAPADFESVFYCNKPAIQALIDHFYKREDLARFVVFVYIIIIIYSHSLLCGGFFNTLRLCFAPLIFLHSLGTVTYLKMYKFLWFKVRLFSIY